ncbi:MAG: NAD-dependent epimerase/dehydratase family protein, partial [Thermoleophilia bacterium]|nr:NAD-dependent epimerase/dehydratase family protein [Thermoleophilia bacterium]
MKVLVTGATGFIGTHVVRALQQHDHEVRALIRPQSSAAAHLQTSEIEIVAGDILDAGSCRRAVTGCDAVLHLAADFRLWAPDPGDIVRTNVEGTRNIMQAALTAEVRRVVHTSTIVALDPSPEDPEPRPADPAQ